jgi:hypothetical protein
LHGLAGGIRVEGGYNDNIKGKITFWQGSCAAEDYNEYGPASGHCVEEKDLMILHSSSIVKVRKCYLLKLCWFDS